uniref:Uncharacterized protein n=1 Tax=Anguilla anguilla TaxID=7936 RepID=A0A0E9Q4H2_ANGAN
MRRDIIKIINNNNIRQTDIELILIQYHSFNHVTYIF